MNTRLKHATWQHMAIKVMRNTTQHNQDIKLNTLHKEREVAEVGKISTIIKDKPLAKVSLKTMVHKRGQSEIKNCFLTY